MIRCIAAIDEKRGLATDIDIPWNLPTDKRMYRAEAAKGIILMGKGTYNKFRKPLPSPNQINYVATRSTELLRLGFEAVNDVPKFFQDHQGKLINNLGGAGLFAETMQYADELLLTLIDADFHCTKFFPPYEQDFVLINQSEPMRENGVTFRFTTWKRRSYNR